MCSCLSLYLSPFALISQFTFREDNLLAYESERENERERERGETLHLNQPEGQTSSGEEHETRREQVTCIVFAPTCVLVKLLRFSFLAREEQEKEIERKRGREKR